MGLRSLFLPVALAACAGPAVDIPPVLQGTAEVDFPPDLYSRGVGGTTQLRLFVDSAGTVIADSARVHRSSGTPALDSAALAAAPRFRYTPGQHDGRPTGAHLVQPIEFRPRT